MSSTISAVTVIFILVISSSLALPLWFPKFRERVKQIEIVNGRVVNLGDRPFQVSLQHNGVHFCGGTLTSLDTVVTAAHCMDGVDSAAVTVVGGIVDLNKFNFMSKQQSYVASSTLYPTYDDSTYARDIAVLKLSSSFQKTKYVKPISLPSDSFAPAGFGVVSGWGATEEGGPISNTLREANLDIYTQEYCKQYFGDDIDGTVICAGSSDSEDACQGDSGGPLTCLDDGTDVLCGVISVGLGCGHQSIPALYTSVPDFVDWVNTV